MIESRAPHEQFEEILIRAGVPTRLTARQLRLIWPGITHIISSYATYKETGNSTYSYPFRVHPLSERARPGQDPGVFQSRLMQVILDLWVKLKKTELKRARLTLNFIDFSICLLSVRIGRDYKRLQWKKKPSRIERRLAASVIMSLERHLKRARRAYAAEAGEQAYKEMRVQWVAHLRWVRMHLAYFRSIRVTKQPRKLQQAIVNECYERAWQGLVKRDYEPPPSKELRHLVRLALWNIRWGLSSITSIMSLLKSDEFAELFLAEFVLDRLDLNPITT